MLKFNDPHYIPRGAPIKFWDFFILKKLVPATFGMLSPLTRFVSVVHVRFMGFCEFIYQFSLNFLFCLQISRINEFERMHFLFFWLRECQISNVALLLFFRFAFFILYSCVLCAISCVFDWLFFCILALYMH